ncbi:MAG: TolC family protein [Bryobacteraceae bacterium]
MLRSRMTAAVAMIALCVPASVWAQGAANAVPEPLSLKQALEIAERASPEMQMARLRVVESEAVALSVKAGLLPQVSARVAQAYQTSNLQGIGLLAPGLPDRVGPYRVFDARPSVSWRVLDMSLLAGVKAAQERTKQNQASADAIAERTRAAVIDLYLQALASEALARAAQARITIAEVVLKQATDNEEAGRGNKLDVARALQQLEKERAALVEVRKRRDVLSTLLVKTIGLDARSAVSITALPDRVSLWDVNREAVLSEAMDMRAERRFVSAKGAMLSREIEQARKERWPTVDAFSNYGVLGAGPDRALSTWQVGASVNLPLWTGRRIENDIKASQARREQWKQEERQVAQQIEQEITEALIEGKAAAEQLQHQTAAAYAARESLELARLRFEGGYTGSLDVATAQGELAQMEEEAIRIRYQEWMAEAKLARARGNVRLFVEGM